MTTYAEMPTLELFQRYGQGLKSFWMQVVPRISLLGNWGSFVAVLASSGMIVVHEQPLIVVYSGFLTDAEKTRYLADARTQASSLVAGRGARAEFVPGTRGDTRLIVSVYSPSAGAHQAILDMLVASVSQWMSSARFVEYSGQRDNPDVLRCMSCNTVMAKDGDTYRCPHCHISESFAPDAAALFSSAEPPMCMQCGVMMIRAGSCFACPNCGTTTGCT